MPHEQSSYLTAEVADTTFTDECELSGKCLAPEIKSKSFLVLLRYDICCHEKQNFIRLCRKSWGKEAMLVIPDSNARKPVLNLRLGELCLHVQVTLGKKNSVLYSDPILLFNAFSFTFEKSSNTVHFSSTTVNQSVRDRHLL